MICKLPAVKRRFAQKCVLRIVAKWKLHSQTQKNSKMICNSPVTARRFAQKMCSAACGKVEITFANAGKKQNDM